MPVPSNRIPVRIARGDYSALTANLASLEEGEIVYAKDQDKLYVVESGALVNPSGASSFSILSATDFDQSLTNAVTFSPKAGVSAAAGEWDMGAFLVLANEDKDGNINSDPLVNGDIVVLYQEGTYLTLTVSNYDPSVGSGYRFSSGAAQSTFDVSKDLTVVSSKYANVTGQLPVPPAPNEFIKWDESAGVFTGQALANVAISGSYNDLSDKPLAPERIQDQTDFVAASSLPSYRFDTFNGTPAAGGWNLGGFIVFSSTDADGQAFSADFGNLANGDTATVYQDGQYFSTTISSYDSGNLRFAAGGLSGLDTAGGPIYLMSANFTNSSNTTPVLPADGDSLVWSTSENKFTTANAASAFSIQTANDFELNAIVSYNGLTLNKTSSITQDGYYSGPTNNNQYIGNYFLIFYGGSDHTQFVSGTPGGADLTFEFDDGTTFATTLSGRGVNTATTYYVAVADPFPASAFTTSTFTISSSTWNLGQTVTPINLVDGDMLKYDLTAAKFKPALLPAFSASTPSDGDMLTWNASASNYEPQSLSLITNELTADAIYYTFGNGTVTGEYGFSGGLFFHYFDQNGKDIRDYFTVGSSGQTIYLQFFNVDRVDPYYAATVTSVTSESLDRIKVAFDASNFPDTFYYTGSPSPDVRIVFQDPTAITAGDLVAYNGSGYSLRSFPTVVNRIEDQADFLPQASISTIEFTDAVGYGSRGGYSRVTSGGINSLAVNNVSHDYRDTPAFFSGHSDGDALWFSLDGGSSWTETTADFGVYVSERVIRSPALHSATSGGGNVLLTRDSPYTSFAALADGQTIEYDANLAAFRPATNAKQIQDQEDFAFHESFTNVIDLSCLTSRYSAVGTYTVNVPQSDCNGNNYYTHGSPSITASSQSNSVYYRYRDGDEWILYASDVRINNDGTWRFSTGNSSTGQDGWLEQNPPYFAINAVPVGTPVPLADGEQLKYDSTAGKFRPAAASPDSIQAQSDFDLSEIVPTYSYSTYTNNFDYANWPDGGWVMNANSVQLDFQTDDGTTISPGDAENNWVNNDTFNFIQDGVTVLTGSFSVSVASDQQRITIFIGSGNVSSLDTSKALVVENVTHPASSQDVPLADGDILQWVDADQKFKPVQLPTDADTNRIQDLTDFRQAYVDNAADYSYTNKTTSVDFSTANANGSFFYESNIFKLKVNDDTGTYAYLEVNNPDPLWVSGDNKHWHRIDGNAWSLSSGANGGISAANGTYQQLVALAQAENWEEFHFTDAEPALAAVTIGDLLRYDGAQFRPYQPAIDNTNRIQDQTDFRVNYSTAAQVYRFATEDDGNNIVAGSWVPNHNGTDGVNTGYYIANDDSDALDFAAAVTAESPTSIWVSADGVTFTEQNATFATFSTFVNVTVTDPSGPILEAGEGPAWFALGNPTSSPIALASGDMLRYDGVEFRPTSDYISLSDLKAEVAAATDFADFQSRIAAL